jgi:hypothetical protein
MAGKKHNKPKQTAMMEQEQPLSMVFRVWIVMKLLSF